MQAIKSIEKTDGYNLDFVEEQAKKILERDGEHHPIAILSNEKNIFIFPMTFDGDKEKQITKEMLRKFVQLKKISRYWIIMESWVSCNLHIDRASRDFNRKEALCISEFSSGKNINGKMVSILFERDGEKIIWKERVLLSGSEGNKGCFRSSWNFYKEDITKEIDDIREKARIADLVMRAKHADISDEIKIIREMWKRDKGTDLEITDDKIKKQLIEVIKTGKIGFTNAIIPEKFRMDTDKDTDNNLNQTLKKRRENK